MSLAALAAASATAAPQSSTPDVHYAQRHVFTVSAGAPARVVEDVEVTMTFVSARSTEDVRVGVGEQYFNRVSGFEAELDGRAVPRRQFTTERVESRDVFLSGGSVQRFALAERPRPGQRLVYRYRRTYPHAAYLPVLQVPALDRVDRFEVVVQAPEGVAVTFDVVPARGHVDARTERDGRATRLVLENLGALDDLPLYDHNGVHAAIHLDLRRGDAALTPTRPEEFAAWYAGLVAPTATGDAAALADLAASLRRETPRATVAAIHDHIRHGIRYIADLREQGAFQPRAPDVVAGRGYGDCKDRAFLAAALARALGLRVDVVLLAAGAPEPETRGVAVGLYNHAIAAFTDADGTRTYFDPTHPYLPFGDLPESGVDGRALRLGADGPEDLWLPAQDTLPTLDVALDLDLDAPADAPARVVVRGDLLGSVRGALERGTRTDAANAVSALAGEVLYRIRLSGLELVDDRPDALTFRGRADLSQFVVASPTRRYLPQTPFRAVPGEARERAADTLAVHTPTRPNVRLQVDVPRAAWAAEPLERALGTPVVGFRADLAPLGGGGTRVTYALHQRTRRFTGAARADYLAFADRYLAARREVVTFTPAE